MTNPTCDSQLDRWITGNYGGDHPDNTDEREEIARGSNRYYHLKTADGPLTFVFCDRCVMTTTTWTEADGELAEDDKPCMECGWTEE
jgi:hypothetical protein